MEFYLRKDLIEIVRIGAFMYLSKYKSAQEQVLVRFC